MKLRHYLGLSLRMYFTIVKYSIFLDVILFAVLSNSNCPSAVCLIIFIGYIIVWMTIMLSIKCPKCNTKLTETYSIFSKYYRGGFHKVPKTCPCCGLNLDEV